MIWGVGVGCYKILLEPQDELRQKVTVPEKVSHCQRQMTEIRVTEMS